MSKMNIDISKAEDVKCDNCGNYTFQEVVLMKRVSPLISPTGQEALIPIPTFACNACGFINKAMLPYKTIETPNEEVVSNTPKLTIVD